jgi:hypothetical protein
VDLRDLQRRNRYLTLDGESGMKVSPSEIEDDVPQLLEALKDTAAAIGLQVKSS